MRCHATDSPRGVACLLSFLGTGFIQAKQLITNGVSAKNMPLSMRRPSGACTLFVHTPVGKDIREGAYGVA